MSKPNIDVAKLIEEKLPDLDEEFDPDRHIAATTDVTGPGIYVIKEIAELANVSIKLYDIPLISPKISEFATRNYIIPNSTSGTNGAIVIVAKSNIIEDLENKLLKIGQKPIRIGRIIKKGEAKVYAPSTLKRFILAKAYLREFEYYEN
jgi:selenophosphate synthase